MYLDLHKNAEKILNFIREQIEIQGYPPSVREMCDAVGLKSTSTVQSHLKKLEKKGYISRVPTCPRAISIVEKMDRVHTFKSDLFKLPILSNVTYSNGKIDFSLDKDHVVLPPLFVTNPNNFVYINKGNGMSNDGILDGDYLVIDPDKEVENGDNGLIILYDEFSSCKKVFFEGDNIRLEGGNDISISNNDVKIVGAIVGVFRGSISNCACL